MSNVTTLFRNDDQMDARRRPPGAVLGDAFRETCSGCGDCKAVCPLSVIETDESGYPYLLDGATCHHCGLCADICTRGAIAFTERTRVGLELVLAVERVMNRP
ncbi:MAG: 4Fe-4S dicluster domain-containing protein [Pseudomonadota bacterium]